MKAKIFTFLLLAAPFFISAQTLTIGASTGNEATLTIGDGALLNVFNPDTTAGIINVRNTGNLVIEAGGSVTTYGIQNTSGTPSRIQVNSDATGDASILVAANSTAKMQIERYVDGGTGEWHAVGIPVVGSTANDFYIGSSQDAWLMKYDEPNGDFAYITDLSTALPNGTGYMYWVGNIRGTHTVTFANSTKSSDVYVNLSYTNTGNPNTDGFNMVGNPFPCTIELPFEGGAPGSDIETSVWMWDPAYNGGDYRYGYWGTNPFPGNTVSLTSPILVPLGQGVLVKAKNVASPQLLVHQEIRTHDRQGFYKSTSNNSDLECIIFKINDGERVDQVTVGFAEGATYGYDNGLDIAKFFGSNDSPQMYLNGEDRIFSVHAINLLEEGKEEIVEMELKPGKDGLHSITVDASYIANTSIVLEDLKTGSLNDMIKNSVYSFNASKSDDPARFKIHLMQGPTGIENPDSQDQLVNIYAWNKAVYVANKSFVANENVTVSIFDMYGRELYRAYTKMDNLIRIPLKINNAPVVVRITNGSNVATKKVYVH